MTITIQEVKQILKNTAVEIKELKSTRKDVPDGYVPGLLNKQYEYRHLHIAYCLVRGRTIDQIEKPRPGNEHNKYKVERLMANIVFPPKTETIKEESNEAVCSGA